jgi:hypothetical protein
VINRSKFWSRFPAVDLRLAGSLLGIAVQGVAWACGIIAIFFISSNMPSLFKRIPPEIQFACEALVVLAIVLLVRMLVERRRTLRAYAQLSDTLSRFRPSGRQERAAGVAPEKMDRIRDACEHLRGSPRDWWLAVDDALEFYEPPSDEGGGWFLTRPARELLPDEDLLDPFYHASFHQAVPGILTALGLLTTFSAILVALSGVSYNAANTAQPVTGIDSLINGLAGKFLSSIIALILSMIFTFVEKKACERRIYREVDALRSLIARIFPLVTQTRILLDLQRIALEHFKIAETAIQPLDAVAASRITEPADELPVISHIDISSEPATAPHAPPPDPPAPGAIPVTWAGSFKPEPADDSPATYPKEDDALATQFGI